MGMTLIERAEAAGKELAEAEGKLNARMDAGEEIDVSEWVALGEKAEAVKEMRLSAAAIGEALDFRTAMAEIAGHAGVDIEEAAPAAEQAAAEFDNPMQRPDPRAGLVTLGEAIAQDPRFKAALQANGTSPWLDINGSLMASDGWRNIKAEAGDNLITGQSTDLDGLKPRPQRRAGITDLNEPNDQRIYPLFNRVPITTSSYEYTVMLDRPASAARIVDEAYTDEQEGVTSTVTSPNIAGQTVNFVHTGRKPYMAPRQTAVRTANIKWLAILAKTTNSCLRDLPQFMNFIRGEMAYDWEERLDWECINGNGTDPNTAGGGTYGELPGLLGFAWGIQTYTLAPATDDLVNVALAYSQMRKYNPNTLLMNSADYFSPGFLLDEDANGQFRFQNPAAAMIQSPIWGMRVVINDLIPAGQLLMLDTRRVDLLDRGSARFRTTESNEDDFETNLVTARLEAEVGLAVRNPSAICHLRP